MRFGYLGILTMSEATNDDPAGVFHGFCQVVVNRRNELRERLKDVERARADMERTRADLEKERQRIQTELANFEELLDRLNASAESIMRIPLDGGPVGAAKETQFDRIAAFMMEQRKPQTIAEIAEGTGISRSSVSAVLYRTHWGHFVRNELGGSKPNTWLLKVALTGNRGSDPEEGAEIPF